MANVVAVPARVGQSVAAGDVLVEIDPQTAKGQEAQAKGALAQARAALSLAERNYERYKALAASGSASALELDMTRMQYEQAKGAVQQGEGAVEAASSVARESRVTAPFAGRVAARLVEAGDLAAPGRPLVTVESATGRRLVVQVPAGTVAASGLTAGQKLSVRIDGVAADADGHRRRDVARRRPGEPHVHGDARAGAARPSRRASRAARRSTPRRARPSSSPRARSSRAAASPSSPSRTTPARRAPAP